MTQISVKFDVLESLALKLQVNLLRILLRIDYIVDYRLPIMIRYFVLFVFVLIFVDIFATKNYIHPVDDDEYELLKELAEGKFCKPKKEMTRKEKSVVIRFWRAKGKFQVPEGKLHYDGKEVCLFKHLCWKLLFCPPRRMILSLTVHEGNTGKY